MEKRSFAKIPEYDEITTPGGKSRSTNNQVSRFHSSLAQQKVDESVLPITETKIS
jgi:hypothetical protein